MKLSFRYRIKSLPDCCNWSRWCKVGKNKKGELVTSIYEGGFNFKTECDLSSAILAIEIMPDFPQLEFKIE